MILKIIISIVFCFFALLILAAAFIAAISIMHDHDESFWEDL